MEQEQAYPSATSAPGHPGEESGGPNVPVTFVAGVIGAILFLVLVVVLQAIYFSSERREFEGKVVAVPAEELNQLLAEQQSLLGSYRWIDQARGIVGIPIERAMELEAAGPR